MKSIFSNKNIWTIGLLVSLFVGSLGFSSCKQDVNSASTPIKVDSVFLEDATSSVIDRKVTFARLGSLIRIQGSGFTGMKKVYINGYDSYFSVTMITDISMLIQVPGKAPTVDADTRSEEHTS